MRYFSINHSPLRAFDLVKDRDTGNSKGYGFCVYQVFFSLSSKARALVYDYDFCLVNNMSELICTVQWFLILQSVCCALCYVTVERFNYRHHFSKVCYMLPTLQDALFQDPSVMDIACAALNGLKMGDRTLTVRRASARWKSSQ